MHVEFRVSAMRKYDITRDIGEQCACEFISFFGKQEVEIIRGIAYAKEKFYFILLPLLKLEE